MHIENVYETFFLHNYLNSIKTAINYAREFEYIFKFRFGVNCSVINNSI